jgi:DUF1016 N-terminal domain
MPAFSNAYLIPELIVNPVPQSGEPPKAAVTLLYWQVGQRIRRDMLHEQRAEYGEQIVATLSRQLTEEFGRRWNKAALT